MFDSVELAIFTLFIHLKQFQILTPIWTFNSTDCTFFQGRYFPKDVHILVFLLLIKRTQVPRRELLSYSFIENLIYYVFRRCTFSKSFDCFVIMKLNIPDHEPFSKAETRRGC